MGKIWIHNGIGVRQRLRRQVVIGNNHLHALCFKNATPSWEDTPLSTVISSSTLSAKASCATATLNP